VALSAAFVVALATPGSLRHGDASRPAVSAATSLTSPDDATDDGAPSPVTEACALLAVLLVVVRRLESSWQVHSVDEADSSRPFRRGDEPCRAPPAAAIA
jgi:hypothetical protein